MQVTRISSFRCGIGLARRLLPLQLRRVLQEFVSFLAVFSASFVLVVQRLHAFGLHQRLPANQSILLNDVLKRFAELILDLPVAIDVVDFLLLALDLHLEHQHFFGEVLLQGLQLVVLELYGLAGEEHFLGADEVGRVEVGGLGAMAALVLAFALALLLCPQLAVLKGQLADLGLQSLQRNLQLSPFEVVELGLPHSLLPYFQQLLENHVQILLLLLAQILPAVWFLGGAFLGLLELCLDAVLIFLQFRDLVFQVEDAEMKVLILILELFYIGRVFFPLAEVFDLLVLLPALSLQLEVVLLQGFECLFEPFLGLSQDGLVVGYDCFDLVLADCVSFLGPRRQAGDGLALAVAFLLQEQVLAVDAGEGRQSLDQMRQRDVPSLQVFPFVDDVYVLLSLEVRGTQACLHVFLIDLDQGLEVQLILLQHSQGFFLWGRDFLVLFRRVVGLRLI